MAVDMFLDLSADKIDGESKDSKYTGKIDVLAWSWGLSQSGTTHSGSGSGAGKANFQDLSFTKYYDKASPNLQKACATGQHLAKAVLICRKAGGEQIDYITMTMENCLISSVSTGGSGGEERFTENVSINFGKFKIEYTIQDAKGKGTAGPEFAYDIAANKKEA
jgi:type VI secretion system secreted protein Hcp